MYTYAGSRGRLTIEPAFTPPADHVPSLRLERGGDSTEVRPAAEGQVAQSVAAFVAAVRGGVSPDVAALRQAALLEAIGTRAAAEAGP